jgi:hypothetical protein
MTQMVRPEPGELRKTRTQPFQYQSIRMRDEPSLGSDSRKKGPFHKYE